MYCSTCQYFQCLDACEANRQLELEMDPIQTLPDSGKAGNVEAACGMAKKYMQTYTCGHVKNEMAIAILNSDYKKHYHDHSSSSSSSSSESWEHGQLPCFAHFDTRFAVGTHAAGWDEIRKFSSSAAKGFYVISTTLLCLLKEQFSHFCPILRFMTINTL